MLAFEVAIDGKRVACAGMVDRAVLSFTLSAVAPDNEARLHIGGLTKPNEAGISHHVRWGEPETFVKVGSKVELKIVETDYVDAPAIRYRSDREVQEPPFTKEEMRALRYKDYLELKKEFESVEKI